MTTPICKYSAEPHSNTSPRSVNIVTSSAFMVVPVWLILMMAAPPAMACSCSSPTICDLIQASTIFIGEVIEGGITSVRQDPWDISSRRVRLKILERFRGVSKDQQTVDINIDQTPGMCAPNPYRLGRKYIVVPHERDDGQLYDGPCFHGFDVETFAEDVRQARLYFAGKMPINVQGQVAVTRHDDLVDFLLRMGNAKPMAGVTVSASREGETYSTVTNSDGRYTLPLPSSGIFEVHANLRPYTSEPAEVSISGRGCAIHNFALKIDNSISGRVLDESGQPVKNAKVGLIDFDRLPSDPERPASFDVTYVERDMNYTFKNVPLGRYLLIFNPEGPRSGVTYNLPFESTYYPLNSTRANAGIIEIKSDGVHRTGMDLVVGKQVEFRRVSVRVKFPDGSKMKTAEIICTGLPLKEGELPWINRASAILSKAEDGLIEFLAPADRRLRLEVRDSHGRNLNGVYDCFYEPDITPIMQEFVVTP